jgi:hypothetical protein
MRSLLVAMALFVSGCTTTEPDPAPAMATPPVEVVVEALVFQQSFNFTTLGSAQVFGAYVHPGQLEQFPNHNCVAFEIEGLHLTRIQTQATWDEPGTLLLFEYFRDYGGRGRSSNHIEGESPLVQDVQVEDRDNSTWLFVGVEAPAGQAISTGLQSKVVVDIRLEYEGETSPSFLATHGCSFNILQ